jgi:hypothetical protein
VWLLPGNDISPMFLRALFANKIAAALKGIEVAVTAQCALLAQRTNIQDEPWFAICVARFGKKMRLLFVTWARKVEKDARILEHALISRNASKTTEQSRPRRRKSGPKRSPHIVVIEELLKKYPKLTARQLCEAIDRRFNDKQDMPTLSHPTFAGQTFNSWVNAYSREACNSIDQMISRARRNVADAGSRDPKPDTKPL